MWALISGPVDYGLYKISGPLPTTAVSDLTAEQIVAPNTASPGGTFGGIAFSASGAIYLASNSPNNKLYQLSPGNLLSFVTNLAVDGIGNDLTSCNFPLTMLATAGIKLSASLLGDNSVVLNWNTLHATNSNGYELEHSTDGISWKGIHFSLKRTDDLSATYTYSDNDPTGGIQYYRVRETDNTGKVTYSGVEKINIISHGNIRLWPNPAQDELHVHAAEDASQLCIFDLSGRILASSKSKTGTNTIAISLLQPGTYILQVKAPDGGLINKKFVKQ